MVPASVLPKLRTDLHFTPVYDHDQVRYVIEDPVRHLFFRVGREEFLLATHLNQAATLADLLALVEQQTDTPLSPEQATVVIQWLGAHLLLQNESSHLLANLELEQQRQTLRRINRLNLISFKLPLLNPSGLLARCTPVLWLTGPMFALLWLFVGLAALVTLAEHSADFGQQAEGFFGPDNLLLIWCIWFSLKLLHEFFHALTCTRYGGKVYEAGLLIILFLPLTYVNATSSWRFPSKWQRMHVAVAGMFIELFVAFVAILIWAHNPHSPTGYIAHNTAIIAGISSVLFNANPLMRFDGYYLLSDYLEIPNLYHQGLGYAKGLLARFFLGEHQQISPPFSIRLYGLLVFCWRIVVFLSLGLVASHLGQGAGIILTMGAGLVWLGLPIQAFIKQWPARKKQQPQLLSHLLLRVTLVCASGTAVLFLLSWQRTIQIPAVVEYQQQYSIHAATSGFVTAIKITDGQRVQAGQVLLVLENQELHFQQQQLSLQLAQLRLKKRIAHSQHQLTDLQLLQEEEKKLGQHLQALQQDLEQLAIKAPGSGMCIAEQLPAFQGRYVMRGQELLWIVSAEQKQLTGVALQRDSLFVRQRLGQPIMVDMRASGMGRFQGTITHIAPGLSTTLPHPALGAMYGGPLDVRRQVVNNSGQKMEQSYRYELFTPRFTLSVRLPLPQQQRIQAGQMASLVLHGERETLGATLWQQVVTWMHTKGQNASKPSP